jgi:ubiquinone/menaquinone biosynthesis C-methylase UbiE
MKDTKPELNDAVDQERWQTAQNWEKSHWLRNNKALGKFGKNYLWRLLALMGRVEKYRGDDRNKWWESMFDNYRFLPASADNALEVGCGPYTNMRLIQKVCKPSHLYLSDPLIRTYAKFKMTFVSEMYGEVACCLDDHPLEDLPFADNYFNLTVMINVLDHVRDADACMRNLIRVTRPGGTMLIGQDLTSPEDLARQPEGVQIGHPITLDEAWFKPYFEKQFQPLLAKTLPREVGWAPEWHYGTLIFAGRKL